MPQPRWPVAECLHEHTRGPYVVTRWPNEIVRTVPEQCLDCNAKHDPTKGWT